MGKLSLDGNRAENGSAGSAASPRRIGVLGASGPPTTDSRIAKDDSGMPATLLRVSAMRPFFALFPFQTRLMAISDYE